MSMDPQDLTDFSNAEGQSKVGKNRGKKLGFCRGVFTATGGKAIGAYGLVGPNGEACVIPGGSVIRRVAWKVLTTFASATNAATIALSVVAANDLKSALAISDGTNPWTASATLLLGIPVTATASTWVNVADTGDKQVTATVAVEALTAGKLVAFFEWFYWGGITLT